MRTEEWVKRVIARPEHPITHPRGLGRTLVTGASGSIGVAARPFIRNASHAFAFTDLKPCDEVTMSLDVRCGADVQDAFEYFQPTTVIHLAGAKHAPTGETDPYGVMETNAIGTENVLRAAESLDAHVVLASTCKAADPETAYGASKLIAERMVLNAGGTVARFYNVVESSGNVFEIWRSVPEGEPIPVVSHAERIFITMREAVMLTMLATVGVTGRFAVGDVQRVNMFRVARELYPDRQLVEIPRRRGDRLVEPYQAFSEVRHRTGDPRLATIISPHDTAGLTVHHL